jgi:nicotinamide riboside kinase
MKIIDFIKGLFKKSDYKERLESFIASNSNIDISSIIAKEIDIEVQHAIQNKLTGFGLDTDVINTRVYTKVYRRVLSELSKSNLSEKEKQRLNSELSMEFIENYIFEHTPIDNDKIIESYQRFIDANMERIKKEDEEAEIMEKEMRIKIKEKI